MSSDLQKAVDALRAELQAVLNRSADIKRAINQLLALDNQEPEFVDVDSPAAAIKKFNIEPRMFLGKNLETSVREYLSMRGKAATAQEILEALEKGSFQFEGNPKMRLKNLAIHLGAKKKEYVSFKTADGAVYGLWEQYPDKKKERDRERNKKINEPATDEVIADESNE